MKIMNYIHLKSKQIIALSGKIASGKSFVLQCFKKLGFIVLNADELTKYLLMQPEIIAQIQVHFPKCVQNGVVVSAILSKLVFGDKSKQDLLESIMLPVIKARRHELIVEKRKFSERTIIYEIPLLHETKQECEFDAIINVLCPEHIRKVRALKRKNMTSDLFYAINAKQVEDNVRVCSSDFILYSGYSRAALYNQIKRIIRI